MDLLKKMREQEYFEEDGIQSHTGLSKSYWEKIIIKELLDNALDAVDTSKNKKYIEITCNENLFCICDSGPGMSESVIDNIYDFTKYTSSKLYRMVSRGHLGNGLKTVIGICYLKNLNIYFVIPDQKRVTYLPDRSKLDIGIVESAFKKSVEPTFLKPGIYIEGKIGKNFLNTISSLIGNYQIVNPDVEFKLNKQYFSPLAKQITYPKIHSVHWYDLKGFCLLAKMMSTDYPQKTTKQFVSIFKDGIRIGLGSNYPRKLAKFFSNGDGEEASPRKLEDIFEKLVRKTREIPEKTFKKYAIGRALARKMPGLVKYNWGSGMYQSKKTKIPFLVEALMFEKEGENEVVTAVNHSLSYKKFPFYLSQSFVFTPLPELKKEKIYFYYWLEKFFEEAEFNEGEGFKIFIHFISPHLEFLDKSKSDIVCDGFAKDLLETVQPLVLHAVKDRNRKEREQKRFLLSGGKGVGNKRLSKKYLMFKYFEEGYQVASGGGKYITSPRQIFYAVRKLVINNYGITLRDPDFKIFTQTVITEMFKQYPDLEDKIHFEQRGTFVDFETKNEFPISTNSVNVYIKKHFNNKTQCIFNLIKGNYSESRLSLGYPIELGVASVLFVEKQGFKEVLKEAGIMDELGLDLILSQGYSTRAIKKLIQVFLGRNIKVYVLHDCDIDGVHIKNKLREGSDTYEVPLDVIDIGLTMDDIKAFDKFKDAEKYWSEKSYKKVIERMSEEEQSFFWPDRKSKKEGGKEKFLYTRVELNALTMPELLDLIRAKIPKNTLIPHPGQIEEFKKSLMENFDQECVLQDALWEILLHLKEELKSSMNNHIPLETILKRGFEKFEYMVKHNKLNGKWQDEIIHCINEEIKVLNGEIKKLIIDTLKRSKILLSDLLRN